MSRNEDDTSGEAVLKFFATAPRPCSYLESRTAISVFADPSARLSTALYDQLAHYGFRRSGGDLYVPACPGCSQCVPVRIPVEDFTRSRNQQRVWRRNRELDWRVQKADFDEDLFALYRAYLDARHAGGGMDDPSEEDFSRFLTSEWSDTFFLVGSRDDRPVVVAVTDALKNALSAVYTFFDPALERESLGTLAILRQIALARDMQYRWLYLGYWIPDSQKMAYKARFRPLEAYREGRWQALETDSA